jgi:anti-sigma factor RsiW
MAYADGELEGKEREEVEALLAKDREALLFVSQVGGLGGVVEALHEDARGKAIASFDVADAVMAKIADEPKPTKAASTPSVSSLDEARARRASRVKIGAGVVAALALAASIFVVARNKETPMATSPVPSPTTVASSEGPGVTVEAVEGAGQSVSVYYLPSSNELSTTSVVVWVDETGEK